MRSVRTSLLEIETVKVKLIFCVLQKSRSATASIIYFYYTVHLYGICRCSVNITTATIPYKFILKTKFSKRCNSCPGCLNNTKFCSQTDLSTKILILSTISAEYADKRCMDKNNSDQRIDCDSYFLLVCILLREIHTLINWYKPRPTLLHKLGLIVP